jgi:hypothetical protein
MVFTQLVSERALEKTCAQLLPTQMPSDLGVKSQLRASGISLPVNDGLTRDRTTWDRT